MKKYLFRWNDQRTQVAYWKLLGMDALLSRSGQKCSGSELAELMGRQPSFATDAKRALQAHYGAEIERHTGAEGKDATAGLQIQEVLSNHAFHFSTMDFMVKEVLDRPHDYPADLVLEICAYARESADIAARLFEEMGTFYSQVQVRPEPDPDPATLSAPSAPVIGTGPSYVLPGPRGPKPERMKNLAEWARMKRKTKSGQT